MGYTQPLFNVRKIAGGYNIYPDGVTTDDLFIYPNPVDTNPRIALIGTSYALIAGTSIFLGDGTDTFMGFSHAIGDTTIESILDAHDLYLKTTGTGVLKFGTYTAGAATDSTGYITIKDALGNTRKLMVQA